MYPLEDLILRIKTPLREVFHGLKCRPLSIRSVVELFFTSSAWKLKLSIMLAKRGKVRVLPLGHHLLGIGCKGVLSVVVVVVVEAGA